MDPQISDERQVVRRSPRGFLTGRSSLRALTARVARYSASF